MISRSTSLAIAFACLATLSVAVAAKVQRADAAPVARATTAMAVIVLPRVVVTGKVTPATAP